MFKIRDWPVTHIVWTINHQYLAFLQVCTFLAFLIFATSKLHHVWSRQIRSYHSNHQQHRTMIWTTWCSPCRSFAGSLWTGLSPRHHQRLDHISVDKQYEQEWIVHSFYKHMGCNNGKLHGFPLTKWTVHKIYLLSGQDNEKLACQHPLIHADHIPPPTQGDRRENCVHSRGLKSEVMDSDEHNGVSEKVGAQCLIDGVERNMQDKQNEPPCLQQLVWILTQTMTLF